MSPHSDQEYKKLLTDVIQRQIMLLGPTIAVTKARQVPGITVADDGTVVSFTGDPQQLTQQLIEQFVELSGLIVRKTMEPLLASYPGLTNIVQMNSKVSDSNTAQPPQPLTSSNQTTAQPIQNATSNQQTAEQPMPKIVN
ncbi:MAG: hypothetical protein KatS3mg089_0906 [Patescibacteria group bacterium]|nr:MAG: hypothetical protein KatS3mg089_0906 [Patescibacteria group bacterium]